MSWKALTCQEDLQECCLQSLPRDAVPLVNMPPVVNKGKRGPGES